MIATLSAVAGAWHRSLGEGTAPALLNGQGEQLELEGSQYAYYQVLVPSNGFPLELELTTLTGDPGMFVSSTSDEPSATNSEWMLPRGSSGMTIAGIPKLLHEQVECNSADKNLGDAGTFDTVGGCANACGETEGCKFFIFGTGTKAGACYMEETQTADCSEGL